MNHHRLIAKFHHNNIIQLGNQSTSDSVAVINARQGEHVDSNLGPKSS